MTGARLLTGAVLLSCAGCFQVSTSQLTVRDPAEVTLRSRDDAGAEVLGRGQDEGVVARGKYWQMLDRVPYVVRARRGDDGAIALHCDTCADAGFPYSGTAGATLLDANGRALPALSWSLDVEPREVTVDYDVCMVEGHRHCALSVPTRLVAPMRDVVEVRRRVEPVRVWGYALLALSAIELVAVSVFTFAPSQSSSFSDRWPWGAAAAVPALTFGGIGLWEVLTPAREQVWTPPAP